DGQDVGRRGAADRRVGRHTVRAHDGAGERDRDLVARVGGIHGHGVDRVVAGSAARHAGQIDLDFIDVGSGQIMDGDIVRAAERVEVDGLDVVEIHRDVGDVAEKSDPVAVGRDIDVFGDVGAVEQQRVAAGSAFNDVAAVARVPDERTLAGAQRREIVPAAADDQVVAGAAEQLVVAVTAPDGVISGAAVDGQVDECG